MKAVFREWYRFRAGEITRRELQRRLAPIELRLQRLLGRHVNNPAAPARKIAKDLREYGSALWTFASVEGVEPTNNAIERMLRPAELWRKGSIGSHSAEGARFVSRILTTVHSLRLQGRNVVGFIVQPLDAHVSGRPPPSVLPAPAQSN